MLISNPHNSRIYSSSISGLYISAVSSNQEHSSISADKEQFHQRVLEEGEEDVSRNDGENHPPRHDMKNA